METAGDKIRKRREELGWSQKRLGTEAGGISQATVEKIEKGQTTRSKFMPLIASRLGIPLVELDPGLAGMPESLPEPPLVRSTQDFYTRDFKVYASVEGGPGEIIRSTDPVDVIPRPASVEHVKEAYGLLVTGESMVPEFRPGETLIVNPKLPIIGGKSFVFYAELDGEARAMVKELRRATPTEWLVTQHNPPPRKSKDFSLPRKEWQWAHRVIGKDSR
jgi:phage repressor protein C with HTH and peptisase S24 domain